MTYKNKIIYNGDVLIDISSDTVTVDDVSYGITFHLKNGEPATGTLANGDSLSYGVEPLVGYAIVGQNALCKEE